MELPGCLSIGFVHQLGESKLICSVYTNKEIELALHRLNFGDIEMKEVNGVSMAEGYRQSSSSSSACRLNATIIRSFTRLRTVERSSLGPVFLTRTA